MSLTLQVSIPEQSQGNRWSIIYCFNQTNSKTILSKAPINNVYVIALSLQHYRQNLFLKPSCTVVHKNTRGESYDVFVQEIFGCDAYRQCDNRAWDPIVIAALRKDSPEGHLPAATTP